MDVISYGKAKKTVEEIKHLDEEVIGKGAESHFKTIDHRLDWIESQEEKIYASTTLNVFLPEGEFINTEVTSGGLKLKEIK